MFWAEVFIACVLLILWSTEVAPKFHLVEIFSGVGEIARVYRRAGLAAAEYDFIHSNDAMNFFTAAGYAFLALPLVLIYLNVLQPYNPKAPENQSRKPTRNPGPTPKLMPRLAIHTTMCLLPFGLLVAGPDCSSWTVVSRGTSWRTPVNPGGHLSLEWVRNNNLAVSRLLVILR